MKLGRQVIRAWLGVVVGLLGVGASAALAADPGTHKSAPEALTRSGQHARVESGKKFFDGSRYAGSERCKGCHEKQYQTWSGTWHAKMERWPTAQTVVADFNQRRIQFKNLRVRSADGKDATINPAAVAFRESDKYFFTLIDQDNPAASQTWEVAKVLGGKWDQGYEVRLGEHNFFPAPIRWSVEQKDWIVGGFNPQDWFLADGTPDGRPLRPDELPKARVAEAKCNGCHMTGFSYQKGAGGVWTSQAQGQGEMGIGCEACHGPGQRHVDEAKLAKASGTRLQAGKTAIVNPLTDLNAEQATQVCGQCHGRGSHKETTELSFPTGFLPGDTDLTTRFRLWNFSGTNNKSESDYFWRNDWASRNRQQYQDFTKSAHYNKAGMSCITCHTFHGKAQETQLRSAPADLCAECHRADGRAMRPNVEMYAGSEMDLAGVNCVDCHMARIGSRSRATAKAGHRWDTSSHVFAVATPLMEKNLGVRSACSNCHEGNGITLFTGVLAQGRTQRQMMEDMRNNADEVRTAMARVQSTLAKIDKLDKGEMVGTQAAALVLAARAKLAFVIQDNSLGAHNLPRTRQLLREALSWAQQAQGLLQQREHH